MYVGSDGFLVPQGLFFGDACAGGYYVLWPQLMCLRYTLWIPSWGRSDSVMGPYTLM